MPKKTGKEFIWTDDETELLLNVTIDYKTKESSCKCRLGIGEEQV